MFEDATRDAAAVLPNGTFRIRQRISGRFLDTHEVTEEDTRLVARAPRDTDTQRWQLTKVGTVFLIRQRSSGRYLDTCGSPGRDVRLVTRAAAHTDSQRWIAMSDGDGACTLRQLSSRRFLDAHEIAAQDFALVTRPKRDADAQKWVIRRVGAHTFTIRQKSSARFVGADERMAPDGPVSTSPDPDEWWIFCPVGAVYVLVQSSTFQLVDAGGPDAGDGALVTRPPRSHDAQRWIVMPDGCGSYTIQPLGTCGFVDAPGDATDAVGVVAGAAAPDGSQRWMFDRV